MTFKNAFRSICFVLVLLTGVAFAQGTDYTAQGGVIVKTGTKLFVPNSTVIAVGVAGVVTTGNDLGSASLVTPPLATGTIAAGGTFGAGGSLTIAGTFVGTLAAGATWNIVTLANGTHYYTLSATLANGAGAFVLQTNNLGKNTFNGAEAVYEISIHLN